MPLIEDALRCNLMLEARSLTWCALFVKSEGKTHWPASIQNTRLPIRETCPETREVLSETPMNDWLDDAFDLDNWPEFQALGQWLIENAASGALELTGQPQSDPIGRQTIPMSHLGGSEWLWFQNHIVAPKIAFRWIGVEVLARGELTQQEKNDLRRADLRQWVDTHPAWFEPKDDGTIERVAGPKTIHNELKDNLLWKDLSYESLRKWVNKELNAQDHRIRANTRK